MTYDEMLVELKIQTDKHGFVIAILEQPTEGMCAGWDPKVKAPKDFNNVITFSLDSSGELELHISIGDKLKVLKSIPESFKSRTDWMIKICQ